MCACLLLHGYKIYKKKYFFKKVFLHQTLLPLYALHKFLLSRKIWFEQCDQITNDCCSKFIQSHCSVQWTGLDTIRNVACDFKMKFSTAKTHYKTHVEIRLSVGLKLRPVGSFCRVPWSSRCPRLGRPQPWPRHPTFSSRWWPQSLDASQTPRPPRRSWVRPVWSRFPGLHCSRCRDIPDLWNVFCIWFLNYLSNVAGPSRRRWRLYRPKC